ncbi:MAG: ArsR family transcriptional regulator [Candidatus Poseidoniaceae archaeon]|nr:ArsR family transcriptional regulator [Candidatus Poseidoniaceae archaeon]
MAGGTRLVVALLAGVFLLSIIPHSYGQESTNSNLILLLESDIEQTYIEGDRLTLDVQLFNPAEKVTISNNPSCEFIFTVINSFGDEVYSSETTCRNQIQTIVIEENEKYDLTTQYWDFTDAENQIIPSGTYTIYLYHSKEPIHNSLVFEFYSSSNNNNYLDLKAKLVDIDDGSYLAQFTIYNPSTEPIITDNIDCTIILENQIYRFIFDDCFNGAAILHPFENIYSSSQLIPKEWINDNRSLKYSILGDDENYLFLSNEISDDIQEEILPATVQYLPSITVNELVLNQVDSAISLQVNLAEHSNVGSECYADVNIVNDLGDLVNSLSVDYCEMNNKSTDRNTNIMTDLYQWELTNAHGCYIEQGKYTLIVGIGDSYYSADYQNHNTNVAISCMSNHINVDPENFILDDSIYNRITLTSVDGVIRLYSNCIIKIQYVSNIEAYDIPSFEICGYTPGNYLTPQDNSYIISHKSEVPDLEHMEKIDVSYKINLEFIHYHENSVYTHLGQTIKIENELISVNGQWDLVQFNGDSCWMISSPNSAFMLSNLEQSEGYIPHKGWNGEYSASLVDDQNNGCGLFGLPIITINSVYSESEPVAQVFLSEQEPDGEETVTITEIALISVTSSSIVFGLLVIISNTESIRIPTTTAGLWLLGLVGKTHETSDGRFQRGRLIGYLTANPGCHFRALMAALSMSNGQITHHLRLLENQELIWRVNDGRFVRYYPLNNSLYPGMNPENLPVPLLSPDPKSLQGKILTLLDDEHQYGDFPTQSELAKKLSKSQQLISHHLRTLQKYGLVEKRKMGIKNRYKLTKEAIFLLETDLEFIKLKE